MRTDPIFSIIVPTHNRVNLVKRAIDSVLAQSFSNWELLIIDDGSTDDTSNLVTSYSSEKITYYYQNHGERSQARNKGIELAQGQYICFLDDDDYYLKHHLMSFYEELRRLDFPKIVLRSGYLRKKKGQIDPTTLYRKLEHHNPVRFAAYNFCGVWSLCIPRTCLKSIKFPPQFRHWQDTYLILLLLARHPFMQLETHTYVYVIHLQMGSKIIYHFPNYKERIQSNVDAISHFFKHHGKEVSSYLPQHTFPYLISKKYLDHANESLLFRKFTLSISLLLKSLRWNSGGWFLKFYFLFLVKFGLKIVFDYPKP